MANTPSEVVVDAGNLAVYDTRNVLAPADLQLGGNLLEHTPKVISALQDYLRALVRTLKHCPQESMEDGTILTLPDPIAQLPREKPMPRKSKFETSWERFTKQKGIRKHGKQLNKEWDENTKDWKDKWGKRAREHERRYDWIREVGTTYKPASDGGDPFLDTKRERKERKKDIAKKVSKNERRRESFERAGVPSQSGKSSKGGRSALPIGLGSKDSAQLKSLNKLHGKIATASMGKFDRARKKV
ncbi:ribosome biogenesis regulatory protein (RRS1) [Perkinsela sp. CCAP 1560/4]|nr:ribosome biogenesis regulatory protein (RRS1) [Perkinsela sp. CCAP 1560/4]|eukprot:KNH06236.1 ribosome biogenesis regulatory protein (RRS1) [Perkinsela sp. CCAP 1560/4]